MTPTYRVLALDLDGTLLTTDKRVTPRATALLQDASRNGMHIVFVTGRNLPLARSVVAQIAVPATVIAHNGAVVADVETGEVVDADFLPSEAAVRLCEQFTGWDCPPLVYTASDGRYLLRHVPGGENPALLRYLAANRSVCSPVPSLANIMAANESRGRPIHVVSIASRERVTRALAWMPQVPGAELMTSGGIYGGEYWFLEALPEGVSKLGAVRRLCERWHVVLGDVAAVGDNLNDVELLKAVGLGIAMGNAPDEVKAAADAVTQSNDQEGVANALEGLLGGTTSGIRPC